MSEINWKSKYEALKAKFMESVDTAFRLGFEQGAQQTEVDQIQQQQQQEAEQLAAEAGQNGESADGAVGEEGQENPEPDSANPAGSELDQHISELEGMLGKSEIDKGAVLSALKSLKITQSKLKLNSELRKSAQAIPAIAKALHKPKFKISQQANHNLSSSAKKAVNMQQEIVEGIMKTWDEEKSKTGKDIISQIKAEGLIKE